MTYDGVYIQQCRLSDHFELLTKKKKFMLHVVIGQNDGMESSEEICLENLEDKWTTFCAEPVGYRHEIVVIFMEDQAVILQAYYTKYTLQNWLNFTMDLDKTNDMISLFKSTAGTHSSRLTTLKSQPKYRAIMSKAVFKSFCLDLDLLNEPKMKHTHAQRYADITGVIMDETCLPECLEVSYSIF